MQQTQELAPHIQEITRALENRVEPDIIEDELRRYLDYGVPLAQAKRDIIRNHGGTVARGASAGAKKLADLQEGDQRVELRVKVLTVNPKEITVKGEQKTIYYGFIADETAKLTYTAWKDHGLNRGDSVLIQNAYVKKGFREGVEVNLGDYVQIEKLDEEVATIEGASVGGFSDTSRSGQQVPVKELRDGLNSVSVVARVLELREKTINTQNGERTLLEGELADESGKVGFTDWAPDMHRDVLKQGEVVAVRNAYVKSWRGVPNLNFGESARVESLPANTLPGAKELSKDTRYTVGELERIGGGAGVVVDGVVLDIKKGSGLIFRCPQADCKRVLQNRMCRIHGKVEGVPDLRIKGVLDDGYGALTFVVGREATEKLWGKTLPDAQKMAMEAMTTEVVQEELEKRLVGRTLSVHGNATSDEFGLQLIAVEAHAPEKKDVVIEAEALLAELGGAF